MSEEQNKKSENGGKNIESKKENADHFPEDSHAPQPQNASDQQPAFAEASVSGKPVADKSADKPAIMETHAHHLHKAPGHGWKHYFFEFFMLFLAVSLGFFVQNQRERFIEKQRAVEYVENLLYDLSHDTARLNDDIDYYKWRENSVDSLIYLLGGNKKEFEGTDFYPKLRAMDTWRVPVGFSNTYDDLKSSGLIRYFTDDGLAGKLKTYYKEYINFSYYEDELAQYVKDFCEPFLDRNFEGTYYITQGTSRQYDRVIFPAPPGKKIILSDSIKSILLNMLIRMRYKKIGVDKISSFCQSQKKKANDLIDLLKNKYDLK